ncbi:hypothetical protein PtA15_8A72 [Puccinia triticina]|uniref:NmrA-like domain-containing protein n=1 Tax=Puccinia triticina TaxID=208348 RepID=A0ABY7CPJ2_9BASI|nr:uncharacterized protein PtA15_8A72 [Puccinia triticina]WAQ87171.1 hypothetical protein PtA15_8A72 [Puccinia triticina]
MALVMERQRPVDSLARKDRSTSSRKNSSVTLAAYPNQAIYKTCTLDSMLPSRTGPSRVIAVVGNIRRGIGRMVLEELVAQKFIVVALVDKPDGEFSRAVETLASSPSLFHAFAVEGGLFSQAMVHPPPPDQLAKPCLTEPLPTTTSRASRSFRSFRLQPGPTKKSNNNNNNTTTTTQLSSSTTDYSLASTTQLSSRASLLPTATTPFEAARARTIAELKNIFQAYRVDTVICSFEPQTLDQPAGPRAKARKEDEHQFGLPPGAERTRIERMERTVLEACRAAAVVARFAVAVHPSTLAPNPLTPPPSPVIPPHLAPTLAEHAHISLCEFRWGFTMNELAFDPALVDPVSAETALGKWLPEPPRARAVVDFEARRCLVPARTVAGRRGAESGKTQGKCKVEAVCMTLAEDVARFVGLACRLREPWDWPAGKMVGECVGGGWEEMVETIEKVSRKKLERQFVCVGSMSSGYASDSGSSASSLDHPQHPQSPPPPKMMMAPGGGEEVFRFSDALRGRLAAEKLDASAVRLREFVRVWFAPLARPPALVVDGARIARKRAPVGPAHSPAAVVARRPGEASAQFLAVPPLATNGPPPSPVRTGPPLLPALAPSCTSALDFNFVPTVAPFSPALPPPSSAPPGAPAPFMHAYRPPIPVGPSRAPVVFLPDPPIQSGLPFPGQPRQQLLAPNGPPPAPLPPANTAHRALPRSPLAARVA